ncbi:hypothetical protein BS78_05G094200 [Paspalum vaginatum]|nr:hypothetical protein BS78_05G094200 [Paspalum vaginatum]
MAFGAPASSPAAQAAHSPSPSPASSRSSSAAGGVSASTLASAPTARPPGALPEQGEAPALAAATGKMRSLLRSCPPPNGGANNRMGPEGVHDAIEKLKLLFPKALGFLASSDNHLATILDFLARMVPTPAPVVTGTPANEAIVYRKKGLLGSMNTTTEKLLFICVPVFLWLLSSSPASKHGQNSENPCMQLVIVGSLTLCFITFYLTSLASKFKDGESIDDVLFKIAMWLLLPAFLALWTGLCMIVHFFAHTPKFVLWPLGTLFSILSVLFWYWNFYKEHQEILKELKKGHVLENGTVLPNKPETEAALAKGLDGADSCTVQISGVAEYTVQENSV